MDYLIVILIICYIVALFSRRYSTKVKGALGQNVPNLIGFIVPAVLLTVFSGLRNNMGDTYFYMHSYNLLSNEMPIPKISEKEILFNYLQFLIHQITDKPQLLIFVGAVLSCVPVIYVIYKYSVAYELSIFLFVATSYYTFSFNGMRQYMAAGILVLGTKYLFSQEKKAWLKYGVIVLIATMFHSSAIIMLPVYFVVRRKSWSVITFTIVFFSMTTTLLFDMILPQFLKILAHSDFSIYNESGWFTKGEETGSSFVRVLIVLLPLVLAYFSRERIKRLGKTGDILVNLAVINFCFYLISLYNWIFARFAIYTGIYYILLLTWLIMNSFKRKDRNKLYIACIIFYIGYFWAVRYSIIGYTSNYF
ncbi:MAG: EpsG family protein [Eubacteriales bacterium]